MINNIFKFEKVIFVYVLRFVIQMYVCLYMNLFIFIIWSKNRIFGDRVF